MSRFKTFFAFLLVALLLQLSPGCSTRKVSPNDKEITIVILDGGTTDSLRFLDGTSTPDRQTQPEKTQTLPESSGPEPSPPEPSRPEPSGPEPSGPEPPVEQGPAPLVTIHSPSDGATVNNPIQFTFSAQGVHSLTLFVNGNAVSTNIPTTQTSLTQTLSPVDQSLTIKLVGLDANQRELASHSITVTATQRSQDKGTLIDKMYITYYYLSQEKDYSGTADTKLYDKQCKVIATVPSKFSDSICIEGSGRLSDGRVLNYASTCSCGRRCPTGGIICYFEVNKSKYPWGVGSKSNPLQPLRSLAVDNSLIPYGTSVYIAEWDGVKIPSVDGIGGFTHDGCFRADDVGGAIKGKHFDFFSGTKAMWKALGAIHPTRKYLTVYKNAGRCKNSP